jgi:pyruvate dehydrogenase E1 component alpha subunit
MDVLAVYAVTKKAIEKAATGGGPTLIEAVTYRFGPHTTADDPTRYREEEELEQWMAKDPLIRMRAFLEEKGMWGEDLEKGLEADIKEEIAKALELAENSHDRDPEEIFRYLFAEMPPHLKDQLHQLKGEERKGSDG